MSTLGEYGERSVGEVDTARANRTWWDHEAQGYYVEHGQFLGDRDFVWGPEGWHEHELQCLGSRDTLAGARILEFGCGGAQGGRWLADQGAQVVSTDLSGGMLRTATAIDTASPGQPAPLLLQCDARVLPFADASFDLVVSAYGGTPFIADSAGLMVELTRVLRPGGLLAFSTSHPIRWAFPDVPGPEGLVAQGSYFDRTPYAERDGGRVSYVEHHRTVGDLVRDIVGAGLVLLDLVEPEWPDRNSSTWGGWSPLRGLHIPGTLVMVTVKPEGPTD